MILEQRLSTVDGRSRVRGPDTRVRGPDTVVPPSRKETPLLAVTLTQETRTTTGILLITVLAVEYGGISLLRIVQGHQPATDFQKSFARAGHAHAAVLVIFAILAQILADAAHLHGATNTLARDGIWIAAILFPGGFFLASAGRGANEPNRLLVLVYAGVAALTAGVLALGVGLLLS